MQKNIPTKVIKVSDLEQIANIDNKDLLLISDIEGSSCISKKMTIGQLVGQISQAITHSKAFLDAIERVATATAKNIAEEAAEETVVQKTMEIVKDNIDDIYDLVDTVKDDQMVIDGNVDGSN